MEKTFEREILDRLVTIEILLQEKIESISSEIASIYRIGGIIGTILIILLPILTGLLLTHITGTGLGIK